MKANPTNIIPKASRNKKDAFTYQETHSVFSNILRNDFLTPSVSNSKVLSMHNRRIRNNSTDLNSNGSYINANTQKSDIFNDMYNSVGLNRPVKKVVLVKERLDGRFQPLESESRKFSSIRLKTDIDKENNFKRRKDKIERFYNDNGVHSSTKAREVKLRQTYQVDPVISKPREPKSRRIEITQDNQNDPASIDYCFGGFKGKEKSQKRTFQALKNNSNRFSSSLPRQNSLQLERDKIVNQRQIILNSSISKSTKSKKRFEVGFNNLTGKSCSGFYF